MPTNNLETINMITLNESVDKTAQIKLPAIETISTCRRPLENDDWIAIVPN